MQRVIAAHDIDDIEGRRRREVGCNVPLDEIKDGEPFGDDANLFAQFNKITNDALRRAQWCIPYTVSQRRISIKRASWLEVPSMHDS